MNARTAGALVTVAHEISTEEAQRIELREQRVQALMESDGFVRRRRVREVVLDRREVAGRGIGLMLLAIFVAGNAVNTGNLLRFGRGQYLAALRFIEKNSDGREIVITSDHDFRNAMLVNYYKRYLERPDSTQYVNRATLDEQYVRTNRRSLGAEWLIFHRFDLREQPEPLTEIYGNNYKLVSIYRYSDLSGWNWLLYHNLNRLPVTPQSPLSR